MKVVSILFCLNYAQIYQYALYNVLYDIHPGQIYPSAFPEMLRVVRPGGYILIAMKVFKNHILDDDDFYPARVILIKSR